MASGLHATELLLQRMGPSLMFIQPIRNGKAQGQSLMIELQSGTVGLAEHSMPLKDLSAHGASDKILGIIGMAKLVNCSVLAVISNAEKVADLRGHPVYKITGTRILEGGTSSSKDDARYISLLRKALDPSDAGRGLYFSYEADLSLTQQRYSEIAAKGEKAGKSLGERAEPRFVWNRHLMKPFTEPTKMAMAEGGPEVEMPPMPELAEFVLPVMQGSVHQMSDLRFQTPMADYNGSITLIARRSATRPGVRHWRRGIAPDGTVANFVETEQLVQLSAQGSAKPAVTSSFVQLRGSIPLLWSQIPNIKYKPTTRVGPTPASEAAFDKHVNDLLASYQNVLAINLANQHGSEGILGKAFKAEAERFAKVKPGFEIVSFDFHKECGATRYDRLEQLWAAIEPHVDRFGTYQEDGEHRKQSGVLRINCIDCLDRTNVVQGWLARKQLDRLLVQLSLLSPGSSIKETFPEVERHFKWIWADHGDDISRQYAGTGALKSGFTRTGKRTFGGLLDDGAKSAMRYLLNNFQDGRKQDALDLLTGTYTISKEGPSPFTSSGITGLPLITVSLVLFLMAIVNIFRTVLGAGESSSYSYLLQTVALPAVLALVLLRLVVQNGKKWVDRPQLCPALAQPW